MDEYTKKIINEVSWQQEVIEYCASEAIETIANVSAKMTYPHQIKVMALLDCACSEMYNIIDERYDGFEWCHEQIEEVLKEVKRYHSLMSSRTKKQENGNK